MLRHMLLPLCVGFTSVAGMAALVAPDILEYASEQPAGGLCAEDWIESCWLICP